MFSENIGNDYIVIQEGTSEGTQVKYKKDGYWYKKDNRGNEGRAEYLVSKFMQFTTLQENEFISYEEGTINGKSGCRSKNFLDEEEELVTFYRLYYNEVGKDLSKVIANMNTMEERIEYVIRFIDQSCGLNIHAYLSKVLTLDMICLNEDRHLNNITILEENGKYHYCPLFDNGEGLMLDNVKYPFDVETRGLMKHLRAKPFQCRFGTVLSAARDLYGAQLKIVCSAAEVSKIAEKYLDWYQPMFRPFLKDRIVDVVLLQMKKYF